MAYKKWNKIHLEKYQVFNIIFIKWLSALQSVAIKGIILFSVAS